MKVIDENIFDYIKEIAPQIAKIIEENQVRQFGQITRYISKSKRYNVLSKQEWNCNQCGVKLKFSKDHKIKGEVAHVDHIHPFSDIDTYINGVGNINEIQNLQGLCQKCNLSKSKKEVH